MDKSTLDKLKNIEQRFFEIEKLMSDPNNASDVQKITKLAKEHSELKKIVNLYQNIISKSSQLKDLQTAHETYVKNGFEGLMIRAPSGRYEPDHRSSSLLKYKTFMDNEYKIVGFKEGKGNDVVTVIFTCETEDGKRFEVRPKGTREERGNMLKNAEKHVGKKLTVKFFELTDEGIPRFPVGLAIRDYE